MKNFTKKINWMVLTMVLSCCVFTTQLIAQTCNDYGNAPGLATMDNALVTDMVTVPATTEIVSDVNVSVDITHTWSADLEVTLTSPAGTTVALVYDACGADDDIVATFDDAAAGLPPSSGGTCPATNGPYQPESNLGTVAGANTAPGVQGLSSFNGEDPSGMWTLNVYDDGGGDGGTVNSWSVEVCTVPNCNDPCFAEFTPAATDDSACMVLATAAPTSPTGLTICEGDAVGTGLIADCGVSCGAATGPAMFAGLPYNTADAIINTATLMGTADPDPTSPCTVASGDDIEVCLEMSHTWGSDLQITLTSPAGTQAAVLFGDNVGGSGNFDMLAGETYCFSSSFVGTPVSGGANPLLTGNYEPTQGSAGGNWTAATFVGDPIAGNWTLTIDDSAGGDDGTITNATISITPPPPVVITWYNAATGGTVQGTGSPFDPTGTNAEEGAFDPNTAGTYTYYVVCEEDGCESEATEVTVVVESADPQCMAQDITVALDGTGNATVAAADIDNGSMVGCAGGTLNLSLDPTAFTCDNIGPNTVTLTVDDGNGNMSTCTAIVTVQPDASCGDLSDPSFDCPPTQSACTGDPYNCNPAEAGGTYGGTAAPFVMNDILDPTGMPPGNYTLTYTVNGVTSEVCELDFIISFL